MENILIGPEFICNLPEVSIGKLYFDHLKKAQQNVSSIDGVTKVGITNKEVFERSVKLAIALRKLGVVEGDVVGLICTNHIEYFVPILASFYLGAVIHPINPIYTLHEIQHAFDISKPKLVFTSESTLKSLLTLQNQRDYLESLVVFGSDYQSYENVYNYCELLQEKNDNVENFHPVNASMDTLACILCSSGTTGLPKGVMLSNRNIRFALSYFNDSYFGMHYGVSTVHVMPFFHVFGFILGMGSLIYGVKVVLLEKFKPDLYLKAIQDFKSSILFLVPSIALFLAKSDIVDAYDLTCLKHIYCGAAPLGLEVETILRNRLSVDVKQLYGMTETCGCICISPKTGGGKSGNSGLVIHGLQLKVEDIETRKILGPNQVGEVCCKGMAVVMGYYGNPKATKEIFDEDGFFLTGDIGYYDEDGFVYIVDRLKELIKYKGFQVSPSELEDILTSHEAIKEAGVIGVPDERSGELPMAFVVRQNGAEIGENEIKDYLAEFVSVQKQLHGGVKFVDEIPKGNTGKILRRKLRELL